MADTSVKTYDIITEAEARSIEPGTTVTLGRGGHVTPLAADTLRARRITVLSDISSVDEARLAPVSKIERIAIGSDHSGVKLKASLRDSLRAKGLAVVDVGTEGSDPVDYPDIAAAVARLVARKEVDAGIVLDGAGIGSAIAANKIDGIRAAMCVDKTTARYAREHNGANILTLGVSLVTSDAAKDIVDTFLGTAMHEARYIRRLAKIRRLEQMG